MGLFSKSKKSKLDKRASVLGLKGDQSANGSGSALSSRSGLSGVKATPGASTPSSVSASQRTSGAGTPECAQAGSAAKTIELAASSLSSTVQVPPSNGLHPGSGSLASPAPGQPLARVQSTQSNSSDDSFHSAEDFGEEAEKDAVQAEPKDEPALVASTSATKVDEAPPAHAPVPKHVQVALDAMAAPHNKTKPLGKPIASLTAQDVAMTEESMQEDVQVTWKALHLFLASRMVEAEEVCLTGSDHKMYYSLGYSLIQALKSLATFEEEDLESAIASCRQSAQLAQLARKKDHGWMESASRLAKGSTSMHAIKAMTITELHAELCHAECRLLGSVLGLIYAGDFVAFLKEALSMRAAYGTYRNLAKFVEAADAAHAQGLDPSLDVSFRSGVELGAGLISLILSLLPSSVLKIVEVFGFTGDREYALETLMRPGLWKTGSTEPGRDPEREGIRRPMADLILLMYHLVIASYLPVGKVDIALARAVLSYNLLRYPNSIFFLYYAGRLHSTEAQPELAIESFRKAIASQKEYVQLGHICYWDLALSYLALADFGGVEECLGVLAKESNWSKAIYRYGVAISLLEQSKQPEDKLKAAKMMSEVPSLTQKIAGKSIPLEKFVARRAKKFTEQGQRLTLGGLEFAYVLNCLGNTPRRVLYEKHWVRVNEALAELEAVDDWREWGSGDEFYDDLCLAHLLRGVILRLVAHPEAFHVPDPAGSPIDEDTANEQALASFAVVLEHGREIVRDHHLVWFAHYERGRLHQMMEHYQLAKHEFELVLSGKNMELSPKRGKGKVSLQNMAVLRSNGALQTMREQGKI